MGGRQAAHGICAAAFPGAHFCHAAEYLLTDSAASIPANGAWIEPSADLSGNQVLSGSPAYGRYNAGGCLTWTSTLGGDTGPILQSDGYISTPGASCTSAHPLACCNGTPKVDFAGFTQANAVMKGRPAFHAACAQEFPGSHMCHAAEYLRADAPDAIPVAGAWIDPSATLTGSSVYSGSGLFGRYNAGACVTWTSTLAGDLGSVVSSNGFITSGSVSCTSPHRIACCM